MKLPESISKSFILSYSKFDRNRHGTSRDIMNRRSVALEV